MSSYFVYILASKRNGTLYIGMTNNIARRVQEHRQGLISAFTKKYKVHHLVYCEVHETAYDAIVREKRMKKWKRQWKLRVIETENPEWKDLYDDLVDADVK